jgi:hypothetical protein
MDLDPVRAPGDSCAMNPLTQLAIIFAGYGVGIYFQNRSITHLERRIDDLRDSMNRRFDDLKELLRSEVKRLEDRIDRPVTRS